MKVNVKIKRLNDAAVIPQYAHEYDAGFDLVATEDVIVEPGETVKVPTGLAFELPPGYEMQIRPRSGITLKTKLRVQLGTVDCGYTGEVGVIVDNIAQAPTLCARKVKDITDKIIPSKNRELYRFDTYIIRKGDRIGQAIIKQVEQAHFTLVEELSKTERGEGGFGSSGVK